MSTILKLAMEANQEQEKVAVRAPFLDRLYGATLGRLRGGLAGRTSALEELSGIDRIVAGTRSKGTGRFRMTPRQKAQLAKAKGQTATQFAAAQASLRNYMSRDALKNLSKARRDIALGGLGTAGLVAAPVGIGAGSGMAMQRQASYLDDVFAIAKEANDAATEAFYTY